MEDIVCTELTIADQVGGNPIPAFVGTVPGKLREQMANAVKAWKLRTPSPHTRRAYLSDLDSKPRPSGKPHLQSGVNLRDDDPVGAGGPVREITQCRDATPLIHAGPLSSAISAAAA